jgi:hypothetical protein
MLSMKAMRLFLKVITAAALIGGEFAYQVTPLHAETPGIDLRLQQVTDWINAVILPLPIADIRNLDPLERRALIEHIHEWVNNAQAKQVAPSSEPPLSLTEDDLFPKHWALWARVPSVKTDVAKASKWVYGVPYGSPKSTAASFYLNPDSYLFTGTATFTFSQAFLSIADRATLCKTATPTSGASDTPDHGSDKHPHCSDPDFILGNRHVDPWQRLISAIQLVSTTSQNPRFSQGIVPEIGTASYEKTFAETVTGTFDPALLFRTATDFNKAVGALNHDNIADTGKIRGIRQQLPCGQPLPVPPTVKTCIDALSYGQGKMKQFLEISVPKIEVKAVTASDLAKSGANTFVQPPTPTSALYEFSATWDLTRWVPNATTRANAADTIKTVRDYPKKPDSSSGGQADAAPGSQDGSTMKWKAQVAWYCATLISHPELAADEVWWSKFENVVLSKA